MNTNISDLISKLTLEEKASLCSGKDFWHTKSVERLNIPSIFVSDGPSGLRTQKPNGVDENDSITSISFPSGCATATSFDRELLKYEGEVLGKEAAALDVSVLLGPAINIKRSPLCGRNFEYLSEDPYLAGELGRAYCDGVQSQNVGTSVKHFAANNQEFRRLLDDSIVDERTLREIYLSAFEKIVKTSKPKTIMCSYNKVNGTLSSENKYLLTDILRNEWGYDGCVFSDWCAVDNRVEGIKAGLNLEMPGCNGITDKYIVEAVRNGSLSESDVDKMVEGVLKLVFDYIENKTEGEFDLEKHHEISGRIAEESCVLLKNDSNVLPLSKDKKISFIGTYAKTPRFEGGGSAHIKEYKLTGALEIAEKYNINLCYEAGWNEDGISTTDVLKSKAIDAAKNSDATVIFAGLPDIIESEGYDRTDMKMPEVQNDLIKEICKVQKNVIVVLHNGAPVEMPWVNDVQAILECYLGGEAIGNAQVKILFGEINPCAKLAETFPIRLEDTPSFINFPGNGYCTKYEEGIFVGYRLYDKRKMEVLFPFGHGLSYTTFEYSNLQIKNSKGENLANGKTVADESEKIFVTLDVTNTGKMAGKEIIQLYVSDKTKTEIRPEKELKGFEKIFLEAGQTKSVTMELDKRSFAYYNINLKDWYSPSGTYEILIGASSRDIRLSEKIELQSSVKFPLKIDRNISIGNLLNFKDSAELGKELYEKFSDNKFIEADTGGKQNVAVSNKMMLESFVGNPIRMLRGNKGTTDADIEKIISDLKEKLK